MISRGQLAKRRSGSGKSVLVWALALAAIAGVGAGVSAATAAPTPSVPVVATHTVAVDDGRAHRHADRYTGAEPFADRSPLHADAHGDAVAGSRARPGSLTGRLVTPDVARRHAIAVMIDDHPDARPQSGSTPHPSYGKPPRKVASRAT